MLSRGTHVAEREIAHCVDWSGEAQEITGEGMAIAGEPIPVFGSHGTAVPLDHTSPAPVRRASQYAVRGSGALPKRVM